MKQIKTSIKQQDGARKKMERLAALTALGELSGKAINKLTKVEQEQYLIILGQLLGVVDAVGKVVK